MKSWLTGSAGGAYTSNLDAMEVNFLSERCLVYKLLTTLYYSKEHKQLVILTLVESTGVIITFIKLFNYIILWLKNKDK